jgi:hypothetical protein
MGRRKKSSERRKSVSFLEHGLAEMSRLQVLHEKRIATLKAKIVLREAAIEVAKKKEAEA